MLLQVVREEPKRLAMRQTEEETACVRSDLLLEGLEVFELLLFKEVFGVKKDLVQDEIKVVEVIRRLCRC